MGWNIFFGLTLLTPLLASIGAILAWRQRRSSTALVPLVFIFACVAVWGTAYSLEIYSHALGEKTLWFQTRSLAGAFLPFAVAAFLLRLAGWRAWPGRAMGFIVFALSLTNCLGIMTNPWHNLFWSNATVGDYGSYNTLQLEYGVWYWFYVVYSYTLTLAAVVLALYRGDRSSGVGRWRVTWIFIGVAIPAVVNLLHLAGFDLFPGTDLSVVAVCLGAFIFYYGLYQAKFFSLTLLSHSTLLGHLRDGILVLDPDARILFMNSAAEWLLGLSLKDLLQKKLPELDHPFLAPVALMLAGDTGPREIARDIDGYTRWFEYSVVPLYEKVPAGSRPHVGNMVVWHEVTFQKEIESELRYASTHDQLTGLHNRLMFEDTFKRLSRGRIWPVAIILADLDNMKYTNDTFGHAIGDELLRQSAAVMRESLRVDDYLARIGGDEFAAMLPGGDELAAETVIHRLEAITARYNSINPGLQVKLSIGWSVARSGDEMEKAFQAADTVMYNEKAKHKLKTDADRTRPLPYT